MSETQFKYLVCSELTSLSSFSVDSVGKYSTDAYFDNYPPKSGHPAKYYFEVERGRILDNYQIIYITKGKGFLWFAKDTEPITIGQGTVMVIPPLTWHSYSPDRSTGWTEYWLGFSIKQDNCLDGQLGNKYLYPVGLQEHLIEKFDEALDIAVQEKRNYHQVLGCLAETILSYILYYDINLHDNDETIIKINEARSIIRDNMMTEISPEQVARLINVSYSWLRKIFKKYTGMSLTQYIIKLKMEKAKIMLLNSPEPVKEIAYNLMYFDTAYFSSIFRKYVGMSPSDYRRNNLPQKTDGTK